MFSVMLFFVLLAVLSDTIDDYTGKIITEEVQSTANFLIIIYTVSILGVVIVANILSEVNILLVEIGGLSAYIVTTFTMTIISVIALSIVYPQIFIRNGQEIGWWEIILNFSLINTLFAVYILQSTSVYFFIIMGIMIGMSFWFINRMGGYDDQ